MRFAKKKKKERNNQTGSITLRLSSFITEYFVWDTYILIVVPGLACWTNVLINQVTQQPKSEAAILHELVRNSRIAVFHQMSQEYDGRPIEKEGAPQIDGMYNQSSFPMKQK